jgi:AcrR family transcriptional regulator
MAKPPDPRVERSRERVLDVAQALLAECGVGGFSVDEVSRRCGVAKTTIYRHWPSRETLVLDAASRISAAETVPDAGSLDAELRQYLGRLAELLQTARWSSVVPSIVDVAERDAEFAEVHGAIQRGHAAPLRAVLERAVSRGDLPTGVDVSGMISALVGPLYYRRWFSREPITDQFVVDVVKGVLATHAD